MTVAWDDLMAAQRAECRLYQRNKAHNAATWRALLAKQEHERAAFVLRECRILLFFTAMFWRYCRDVGAPDSEAVRRRFVEDCQRMQEREGETIDDLMQLFEETGYGT